MLFVVLDLNFNDAELFSAFINRCPYHMPDSFKDLMPRDMAVASTSRLFLALMNLFVAASSINFETFIRVKHFIANSKLQVL